MIYDSGIWKDDLQNEMNVIISFFEETDLDFDEEFEEAGDPDKIERDMMDVAFLKLQKFVIYSSIIIRKLIESNKISDEFMGNNFPITSFAKVDKTKVNLYNGYEIEKLYNLKENKKIGISLKNLSDTLIHSFHFMPDYDWQKCEDDLPDDDPESFYNNGLLGFYFSSDKTKEKELYYIPFKTYTKILQDAIKDRIVYIVRNGEGEIIKKSIKNGEEK